MSPCHFERVKTPPLGQGVCQSCLRGRREYEHRPHRARNCSVVIHTQEGLVEPSRLMSSGTTPGGLLRPQESYPTCSRWGCYIFQLVGIEKSVRETCSGGSEVLPQICISTPRSQQDPRPRQPPGPVAPAPPALAGTPLLSKSVLSSSQGLVRAAARLWPWPPPPSVPTPPSPPH